MDHSLMALAPQAVAGVHQAATAASQVTFSAASGDILSNSKIMALAVPGTLGVFLIVIGGFYTIRKLKEGIGEALMYEIGVIVVGVVLVLSVGIAAAVTDFAVDQNIVDQKYVRGDEWGQ